MLPADTRLFTWIDVEEVIQTEMVTSRWPDGLVWVRAYWDSLTFGIRPEKEEVVEWLAKLFEPRFDKERPAIILESNPDSKRLLDIVFEETTEAPPRQKFKPSLQRPSFLSSSPAEASPPEMAAHLPPVIAFHSFKGGVGRTINALAMAKAITNLRDDARILFIDADLEAPGVTWLIKKRFPNPSVSFADFLALLHGDPSSDGKAGIDIVADRLKEMLLDNMYILPAFRTGTQFTSLEIRPEHLIQGAENPFILSEAVATLGFKLGVDAVVVDLRAGLSELSTGFLLDPRVFRVIVTTLSSQSIEGTCQELDLLGSRAPSKREDEPVPSVIFSQVPEELLKNGLVARHEERVLEAARLIWEAENEKDDLEMPRIVTSFSSSLQVLPNSWADVMRRILQAGLIDELNPLLEWLPLSPSKTGGIEVAVENGISKRKNLAAFSKKLIYAETSALTEFLSIPPLKNLASDFMAKIPVSVVVGAKGSGKTFTYLQVVFRNNWAQFINDVGISGSPTTALICPVMKSKNIVSDTNTLVLKTRTDVGKSLGFENLPELSAIYDHIREKLREDLHEGDWRELWIDILAWSAGFDVFEKGAGKRFSAYLTKQKKSILPIIDGLEDQFQDLSSNRRQQTAIRSLIQEVPEWLEQQPDRNIGLLVFIRQDMVLTAVKQNAPQLMARYEPHALRWSPEEALRLAAWIGVQSRALATIERDALQKLNKEALTHALAALWGRKLGSEGSREARSANWVIAALSDLKGQIQARDLVRFLHQAAVDSEKDAFWKDRILVPTAIRGALQVCSKEKINEIGIENSELKGIFNKLSELNDEHRQIPFLREEVGLTIDELKALENNGIAYGENEAYYMPEIFRTGLGFRLKAGARPRVLALSRKIWTH